MIKFPDSLTFEKFIHFMHKTPGSNQTLCYIRIHRKFSVKYISVYLSNKKVSFKNISTYICNIFKCIILAMQILKMTISVYTERRLK